MLCKFSNSNATFNCPRVSVSVMSSGFYSETSKMAGDTGTISGNLPRLFMRVLGWLRLRRRLAPLGVYSDALPPRHLWWLRYRTIFHSPARRREARTTRQPRVKVRFAWSVGHPLRLSGWGGGVGGGENLMFGDCRCVIKQIERTATCRWHLVRTILKNRFSFC